MNLQKSRLAVFVIFLLIIPSLAYPYKKVKCFVLKPPEKLLPGVKRIAILDFETQGASDKEEDRVDPSKKLAFQILSKMLEDKDEEKTEDVTINYGRHFSNYLISKLIESDRGIEKVKTGFLGLGSGREGKTLQEGTFTNIYEIVERSQLIKIFEEQALAQSGAIGEDQVIQIGEMLGAQAIIMGNVDFYHSDEKYTEKRTVKKKKKKTTKTVNCQKRQVNISVRARIISAETGQILGSTDARFESKKKKCEGDWGSLPTISEMMDEGLQKLSTDVANYFAPNYKLESYELEKVKEGKYKKKAEKAAKLAENLKIDNAHIIYKSIYEQDAYNPEVLFNLAITHEVVANFQKAEELYNMALQLKDEDKYTKALKRMEKNVEFSEALTQIGIEIKEHSFEVTDVDKAKALARKIETKGSRKDRVVIYSQPNDTSEVVEKVPGSLTFTVIKREGDWYFIQLLGQKQGYVHKDKVNFKE